MCKITYQTLTKYTMLGGSYFQVSQIQESEIAVACRHHMNITKGLHHYIVFQFSGLHTHKAKLLLVISNVASIYRVFV